MKKYVFFILLLISLLGCDKKNKTDDFLNQIDVNEWNNITLTFMKKKCSNNIFKNIENEILIKNYIEYRKNLILKLKENKSLFGKHTKTLVVSEDYLGTNNIKVDYTIINNNMKRSVKINHMFDKVMRGHELSKAYDYDTIINQKIKCINQIKFIINSMRIETVIHINDEGNIIFNTKGCYFSEVKLCL